MNTHFKILALALVTLFAATGAVAKNVTAVQPKVVGMYFYASWCASCKTLDPNLEEAKSGLKKEAFLLTQIDVSNKVTQHQAGMVASSMGLGELYQETGIKTGFVILVDPATGEVIDRINKDASAKDIVAKIKAEVAKRS